MTASLASYRRFFAEEVEIACGLRTHALVNAFATVERERFLGPGPWLLKGADGDFLGQARQTPDADPRRVYHNVAIALDPARQLFNGQPGTIAAWIDHLALESGQRVVHIGAGTGYYTAILAECVGPTGRVVAFEADEALAARARGNLADVAHVQVLHGDATHVDGPVDAILVNAGATHPLDAWLDALAPSGRLVVPITFAFGGTPIAKGVVSLITRHGDDSFEARAIGFVAIYAAVGVREEALNDRIGKALQSNPMPRFTGLRRDAHESTSSCWLHGERFCLQAAPVVRH
jgi:protein-L-isoaspartate(D-aspartate) O-methyltransferase